MEQSRVITKRRPDHDSIVLWVMIFLLLAIHPALAGNLEVIKHGDSPIHYGGRVFAKISINHSGRVSYSKIENDSGAPLRWIIERNQSNEKWISARTKNSYKHADQTPGVYRIFLVQKIQSEFQVISNVVRYRIGAIAALDKTTQHAIIQLPNHENYHEISYTEFNGQAFYQGDIDLGSVSSLRAASKDNVARFRSGELEKKRLRLRRQTLFGQLKSELNIKDIEAIIASAPKPPSTLEQRSNSVKTGKNGARLWPNSLVPYEIATSEFKSGVVKKLQEAIAVINKTTQLHLVPYRASEHRDFLHIQPNNSPTARGSSKIGRMGGKQRLTVDDSNWLDIGIFYHELMHSFGFYHMQTRKDRDLYVCVLEDNIEGNKSQFAINDANSDLIYGEYDIESVMHSRSCAHSKCSLCKGNLGKCATIVPRFQGLCRYQSIGGQRKALTKSDIDAINYIYRDPSEIANQDGLRAKNVTLKILSLKTIAGPEENGAGCNNLMDFQAMLMLSVTSKEEGSTKYRLSTGAEDQTTHTTAKLEGNNLQPTNWQLIMPQRISDRYMTADIYVRDIDKSGVLGAGACGKDDDPVWLQKYDDTSTRIRLLIDTDAESGISIRTINRENEPLLMPLEIFSEFKESSLGSREFIAGEEIVFAGSKNKSHAAEISFVINVE